MGNLKICLYCSVTADTLAEQSRKCSVSSLPAITWTLSKLHNLAGCHGNWMIKELERLSRDNFSSLLFALVTYKHVKNWFTHSLHKSQTTSCLDSNFFLILFTINFYLWYLHWPMTILLSDLQMWPWPSTYLNKCFKLTTKPNYFEIHV